MDTATATILIRGALKDLGVFEASETPPTVDYDDGLILLNQMVSFWRTQRLTMKFLERYTKALVSGTATYTIGTDGTDRLVDFVSLVLNRSASPIQEVPLGKPLTALAWEVLPNKVLAGTYPNAVYIDNSGAVATMTAHVYPVPNQSTSDLVLYMPTPVAQFAALATSYNFLPGYVRALRMNLALELAPGYDVTLDADYTRNAKAALDFLKATNLPLTVLRLDPALTGRGGRYDINTDS